MSKKLKKMPFGGTPQSSVGQFAKNAGLSFGDTALSALGLTNVIPDNAYQGTGANFLKGYSNVAGGIANKALPLAGQAFGIPAPVTGAALSGISHFNPDNQMPNGGPVNAPNVEVEKQENTLNPDGSTTQFNGPGHEQGGIPTQLDPNTLVFSDRLKKGGKTYADLNKPNQTKKEDKVLNDPKANKTAKLTAQIMMQAKNKQSLALYQDQEATKAAKVNKYAERMGYKMPMGGKVPMYPEGGLVDMEDNTPIPSFAPLNNDNFLKPMYEEDMNPSFAQPNRLYGMDTQDPIPSFNNPNSVYKAKYNLDGSTGKQTTNNTTNYNPYVAAGGALLGSLGDIYDLKNASNVPKETYQRYSPQTLDGSQDIRDNNRIYKGTIDNLKNASGGNASTYLQNRNSLAVGQMNANSRILQQYKNLNAGINNQAGMFNTQLGQQETVANIQNLARSQDLKSNAYRNIGTNASKATQMYNRDINSESRDQMMMDMIKKMYPEMFNRMSK